MSMLPFVLSDFVAFSCGVLVALDGATPENMDDRVYALIDDVFEKARGNKNGEMTEGDAKLMVESLCRTILDKLEAEQEG
jgi:hypothetical protein